MSVPDFNKPGLFTLLGVAAIAVVLYFFQNEVMFGLRKWLEDDIFKVFLSLLVFSSVITHTIVAKRKRSEASLITNFNWMPLDLTLTLGTYVAVTTTACELIEGALVQTYFEDVVYFTNLGKLDLYALLGVSGLMLWYVGIHVYKMLSEVVFQSSSAKVVVNAEPDSADLTSTKG